MTPTQAQQIIAEMVAKIVEKFNALWQTRMGVSPLQWSATTIQL
ncbi:MAG: hypothetical protein ABH878_09975 [bacterium]